MQYTKPENIKIKEGLPRLRKELGNINKLGTSILRFGQLQPIVVTRNMELICGGRRLAACIAAGVDVGYVFKDELDHLQLRLIELEENIARKQLEPAEIALATEEFHSLKQKEKGIATSGKEGGWTLGDTAKELGVSKGSVHRDIEIAQAVKRSPELKKAKTKAEILSAMKGKNKLIERALSIAKRKSLADSIIELSDIVRVGDAINDMATLDDKSVDVLLTDPGYGIDIDKTSTGVGGITGNELTTSGFSFNDSENEALELYDVIASESYRFCSSSAHAIIFCAPSFFHKVSASFASSGWLVSPRPMIWIKRETGQSNQPSRWPVSAYEMMIFARKGASSLYKMPIVDWMKFDIVNPSAKSHPTEKPLDLLKYLLEHVGFANAVVYDPCAGSFSTVVAAIESKMRGEGNDIKKECHMIGLDRVGKILDN